MLLFGLAKAAETVSASPSPTPAINISDSINQVGQIAKDISQYGVTNVLIGLFIVCFLGLFGLIIFGYKKLNKDLSEKNANNENMMKRMFEVCLERIKEESQQDEEDEARSHKEIVGIYIDSRIIFKDAAKFCIEASRCNRIEIYLFHNGNHTPFGFPFAKMSRVYSQVNSGMNTIQGTDHTDMPLYAFSSIVDALWNNGEFFVQNIYDNDKLTENAQIIEFIGGIKYNSIFALPITDKNGCMAAFTVASFKEKQDFSNPDTYYKVKKALAAMNKTIYPIIINDSFKEGIQQQNANMTGED